MVYLQPVALRLEHKTVNCTAMLDTIKQKLLELEKDKNIRILYACESGSRAWGFPSPDSDYDVRFIYARRVDDYLKITDIRDVVDLPVNEVLDIGGWDIRKALKLFLKSNGALYEWLQSPIVYQDTYGFAEELRQLMPKYFSLRACGNHYLAMALNTLHNDLQGEEVKLKRYFYALRSALACKWIIERQTVPPMEFKLLRVLVNDLKFQQAIDGLLEKKQVSDEKTLVEPNITLSNWLTTTLESCKERIGTVASNHQLTDELDTVFRKYILR
jgi:predicted nucleotidyltransferase